MQCYLTARNKTLQCLTLHWLSLWLLGTKPVGQFVFNILGKILVVFLLIIYYNFYVNFIDFYRRTTLSVEGSLKSQQDQESMVTGLSHSDQNKIPCDLIFSPVCPTIITNSKLTKKIIETLHYNPGNLLIFNTPNYSQCWRFVPCVKLPVFPLSWQSWRTNSFG